LLCATIFNGKVNSFVYRTDDVVVLERRSVLGFYEKALFRICFLHDWFGQHLKGDLSLLSRRKKEAQERSIDRAEPGASGNRAGAGLAANKTVEQIAAGCAENDGSRFP
jgi:hypothetical protein